jgi:hypothetical protein
MRTVYSSNGLAFSIAELSVQEWLDIKESDFFGLFQGHEEHNWLSLQHAGCLLPMAALLVLADVGGELYRLNGKARQLAWAAGQLPVPSHLVAQVIAISASDFMALGDEIKAKRKASLPVEGLVKDIYLELGLSFSSARFKEGFISEALTIAFRGRPRQLQDKRYIKERVELNLKKAIGLLSEEMRFIDGLDPKPEIFMTGVLAAALIMLGGASPNTEIREFLVRLNNGQGETRDGLEDPVAGLLRVLESYRRSDSSARSYMAMDLCRKAVQSITLWQEGEDSPKFWRKKLVTGVDYMPYIRVLKHQKQVYGDLDM